MNEIGRCADLNQPQGQVLRDRCGAVLRFYPPRPLGSDGFARLRAPHRSRRYHAPNGVQMNASAPHAAHFEFQHGLYVTGEHSVSSGQVSMVQSSMG
jgi:hypothetical protein